MSESVNRRGTDNTIAKREKRTKRQATILYTNTERSDQKGYFPSMLLTKIKIQLKLNTAKLVQSLHNIT
jgi:hypothetical protein